MTLGKLITRLLRPCSSAPKSPTPPSSPNAEPTLTRKGDQIVEVTPCMDISNEIPGTPSSDKDRAKSSNDKAAESIHLPGALVEPPAVPGSRPLAVTEAVPDASDKLILDVFGFDTLHQLQGKTWDERGQAVQAARARVVQGDLGSASLEDFFHAGCCVALIALKDKVMPVFFDGLDIAKLLLGEFASQNTEALSKQTLKQEVDHLVPVIVAKTSDRNARSIEGTRQALVFLARQPNVGCQQVVSHILTPITNTKDVAAIRGRLELIGHIMDDFGFAKASGLSLSTVMGFVRPHLDAADEKVRRAAVEVTVSCYSLKGERTMKYCSNLKPALLKLLEQRFAEVDSTKGGGKKMSTVGTLPEVRGTKIRKPPRNGSSGSSRQSSSSGSVGIHTKPLAPLDMSPGGRMPNRIDSREKNTDSFEGRQAILEDKVTMPHTDIFAPVYNDVLRSPVNQSPISSPELHYGMAVNPAGQSSLARHEDPNYIPSPKAVDSSVPFNVDDDQLDEAFMNEIEGL